MLLGISKRRAITLSTITRYLETSRVKTEWVFTDRVARGKKVLMRDIIRSKTKSQRQGTKRTEDWLGLAKPRNKVSIIKGQNLPSTTEH